MTTSKYIPILLAINCCLIGCGIFGPCDLPYCDVGTRIHDVIVVEVSFDQPTSQATTDAVVGLQAYLKITRPGHKSKPFESDAEFDVLGISLNIPALDKAGCDYTFDYSYSTSEKVPREESHDYTEALCHVPGRCHLDYRITKIGDTFYPDNTTAQVPAPDYDMQCGESSKIQLMSDFGGVLDFTGQATGTVIYEAGTYEAPITTDIVRVTRLVMQNVDGREDYE